MNDENDYISWEDKTKEILNRLIKNAPQEGFSLALSQYYIDRRPFALSKGTAQDFEDKSSRLVDLICGAPYISSKHPWPKNEEDGLLMQPILQLNIASLNNVFGVNWGDDLIQVWARVGKNAKIDNLLSMRILPRSDLSDPIEDELQNLCAVGYRRPYTYFESLDFIGKECCSWSYAGRMYGTRQQLLDFSYNRVNDFNDGGFEWLDAVMEELSESPLCGDNISDCLGGWGGKHGENDASYGDGLIIKISDGDGALVAIHRRETKFGVYKFFVSYSLR